MALTWELDYSVIKVASDETILIIDVIPGGLFKANSLKGKKAPLYFQFPPRLLDPIHMADECNIFFDMTITEQNELTALLQSVAEKNS